MATHKIKRGKFAKAPKAFNDWLDYLVTKVENLYNPSVTGDATLTVDPNNGWHLSLPRLPIGLGITTGTITARVSTTLGTGTADFKLLSLSGSNVVIVADAGRTGQTVYNFSAAGTVASGKYFVWVRILGYHLIVAVEC